MIVDDLITNLRFLCAEKASTAKVCRDIGINQQQFSKYLSGRTKPSANNLRRIARYFGVDDADILGSHAQLVISYRAKSATLHEHRQDPLANVFPGDLSRLRPFLGAYQVYFRAPVDPNGYVVNSVFLDERNGVVYSRLIEALSDTSSKRRRWTRCDGKVSYQNGRLFIVDSERKNENALSMHILTPPPRQKRQYLFGTMCFLASMPSRMPYASKVVWRKYEAYKSVKELFKTCGVFSADSLRIDPVIQRYLASPTGTDDGFF
ncbi:helix-turn-helix transcriptional regulator [Roseibium sp. MMSF_3544]|uniref:helix-turn-helix domain-containing protein n=1 Tax=unclassified Roseibium TaxID=2629323 RepID=UPI00273D1573|nr:helix-turn-helix transcriptional regulator [Roseibium sp. MMSF_3544]